MPLGGLHLTTITINPCPFLNLSELRIITQAFHYRTVKIPFKLEPPRANKLPEKRFIRSQTTRILRD